MVSDRKPQPGDNVPVTSVLSTSSYKTTTLNVIRVLKSQTWKNQTHPHLCADEHLPNDISISSMDFINFYLQVLLWVFLWMNQQTEALISFFFSESIPFQETKLHFHKYFLKKGWILCKNSCPMLWPFKEFGVSAFLLARSSSKDAKNANQPTLNSLHCVFKHPEKMSSPSLQSQSTF